MGMFRTAFCILFAGFVFVAMASASAGAAGWKCSARGLQNGNYDGGSTAYIHLSGYSWGHNYPVTKVTKNKVKGKTKDGTPFTCIKQ